MRDIGRGHVADGGDDGRENHTRGVIDGHRHGWPQGLRGFRWHEDFLTAG